MTKQQQIDDLKAENARLNESLSRANARIDELEEALADKRWPKLEALDAFETAVNKATSELRKQMD